MSPMFSFLSAMQAAQLWKCLSLIALSFTLVQTEMSRRLLDCHKFYICDVHGPQSMNLIDFGDPLTKDVHPLVVLKSECLGNYWMHFHEMCLPRDSLLTQ